VSEDASVGIAQASLVDSDEKLAERVKFVHERVGTAAIAEQYIEGRELYVCMLGNERLRVLPVWELAFGELPPGSHRIATEKLKFDLKYQERRGVTEGLAKDLAPEVRSRVENYAKRIFRTLSLDGYARIDFRLSAEGIPYFIEANPNPEIASSESFAQAARHGGLKYRDLLQRILTLGMQRAQATG
jgi:D-alanine-D-alanine ligase